MYLWLPSNSKKMDAVVVQPQIGRHEWSLLVDAIESEWKSSYLQSQFVPRKLDKCIINILSSNYVYAIYITTFVNGHVTRPIFYEWGRVEVDSSFRFIHMHEGVISISGVSSERIVLCGRCSTAQNLQGLSVLDKYPVLYKGPFVDQRTMTTQISDITWCAFMCCNHQSSGVRSRVASSSSRSITFAHSSVCIPATTQPLPSHAHRLDV